MRNIQAVNAIILRIYVRLCAYRLYAQHTNFGCSVDFRTWIDLSQAGFLVGGAYPPRDGPGRYAAASADDEQEPHGGVLMLYHGSRDAMPYFRARKPATCLSGGPMLDSAMLAEGHIGIIGVFTDYVDERGMAYGESSMKLAALLRRM